MTPKVSVCIPTFNRRHLLRDTLDSVFAQSYKDFEVVIVDDGSTDGTKEMIDAAGYNVRYHWQQNAGDAAARNKLIELAKGQYISFLDSDDLLFPDALEAMVKAIDNARPDAIIYGPYVAIDEKGKTLKRRKKKLYNGKITQQLFDNIMVHSCGSLFPKDVLLQAGQFDTTLPVCSDYDLWLRLSLKYEFIAVDKPLFKRRRHLGNISQNYFAHRDIELKVLENFYYNKGGKELIPWSKAIKRLNKERYRAARAAIRESLAETAIDLLKKSLAQRFNLKSLFWLFIAGIKFLPWLNKTNGPEKIEPNKTPASHKQITQAKIAIDFNPVLVNRYSGFYTFGMGLLEGFSHLNHKPELLLFYASRFEKEAQKLLDGPNITDAEQKTTRIKMRWLEKLWKHINKPSLQFFTGQFDIYHSFQHLMPPTNGKPRLMTVHDLRRYALPELYRESKLEYFETAVKKADHFLAVSESTKTDLCKFFNIPEQKVDVAHLATNLAEMELSDKRKDQAKKYISEHLGLEADNYLVTLSSPDQRKNIRRTVEAFGHAQSQLPGNMKLLIIGQLPKRETQFVEDLNAGKYKNVVCPGPVDELWPWLVCAKALVFASLYEGFGIPILEAFSCQLPVITSQCSSMPEVAGDAAVYVDPHNTDSIAQAIIKVCGDSDLRESLIQKGKIRNADFSWKKTAQKTIEAYQKLL